MRRAFLKWLKVHNFKSFVDLDVEFGKFNVLVGSNASGKSNFAQIFKFLSDMRGGLDGALAMQGGIEYVRNFNSDDRMSIELEIDAPPTTPPSIPSGSRYRLHSTRAEWKFALEMGKRSGFRIISDAWKFHMTGTSKKDRVDGIMQVESKRGKTSIEHDFPAGVISEKTLYMYRELGSHKRAASKSASSLESPVIADVMFPWVGRFFDRLEIYDFAPKLARRPSAMGGKPDLESDGSNLPLMLRDIMSNSEKRRKFHNLASDMLPFVKHFGVKTAADKSLVFRTEERRSKGKRLPAALASDGTANAVALIVALHFEDAQLAVIEGPERGVHPALLSGMVDMMKDASSSRQIIATTHSPEIVRQSGIDNLLLLSRRDSGSGITRPAEVDEVMSFLEGEMDIGEMHVQGMLGD